MNDPEARPGSLVPGSLRVVARHGVSVASESLPPPPPPSSPSHPPRSVFGDDQHHEFFKDMLLQQGEEHENEDEASALTSLLGLPLGLVAEDDPFMRLPYDPFSSAPKPHSEGFRLSLSASDALGDHQQQLLRRQLEQQQQQQQQHQLWGFGGGGFINNHYNYNTCPDLVAPPPLPAASFLMSDTGLVRGYSNPFDGSSGLHHPSSMNVSAAASHSNGGDRFGVLRASTTVTDVAREQVQQQQQQHPGERLQMQEGLQQWEQQQQGMQEAISLESDDFIAAASAGEDEQILQLGGKKRLPTRFSSLLPVARARGAEVPATGTRSVSGLPLLRSSNSRSRRGHPLSPGKDSVSTGSFTTSGRTSSFSNRSSQQWVSSRPWDGGLIQGGMVGGEANLLHAFVATTLNDKLEPLQTANPMRLSPPLGSHQVTHVVHRVSRTVKFTAAGAPLGWGEVGGWDMAPPQSQISSFTGSAGGGGGGGGGSQKRSRDGREGSELSYQPRQSSFIDAPPASPSLLTYTLPWMEEGPTFRTAGSLPNLMPSAAGAVGAAFPVVIGEGGRMDPGENAGVQAITKPMLAATFHLPIDKASAVLGIGIMALKKICRDHNVNRWPYRKVVSINKLIESVRAEVRDGVQSAPSLLRSLERCHQMICEDPSYDLPKDIKKMRQVIFKNEFKARRASCKPSEQQQQGDSDEDMQEQLQQVEDRT